MWSSGRRVLQDLLSKPAAVRSFSLTPAQSTVVVERWYQVPLSKKGSPPRLHPRRHRIYKLVEDTKHAPKEKLELILTQTVPKLGGRGDTVFVKKSFGRNRLLLQGLAVYPSPENKQIFAEELRLLREGKPEDRVQTRTGQMTVKFLKNSKLTINKMPSEEFQVTKEVVQRQLLKKLGLVVPSHALSLPFESVKELGDYWCEVTVNGINTVRIPVSVVPFEDPSASYRRQLKAQEQEATGVPDLAGVDVTAVGPMSGTVVEAVSDAAVETVSDVSVEAVSDAAVETVSDVSVEAVSDVSVEAVSDVAVEAVSEAAVEAVSDVAVEAVSEAAVEAVSDVAVEAVSEAAVEAVSDVAVEAVSDAAVEAVSDAAVKAVSDAAVEAVSDAAVEAVSDAAVEAEAGKDSVSQVSEASASEGASAAKETAASEDTTAPPSDNPKKD
ncbi:large ribosomal subunit protein bL9m [Acanthopagrus schlegelii]